MSLILASRSLRRQQILRNAGIAFELRPAAIDETPRVGEATEAYVRRMATEKALSVACTSPPGRLVLGADTAVENDGKIFGKPESAVDAARMLRSLSGKTHRVLTGICIVRAPDRIEYFRYETTHVTFCPLEDCEIEDYIASGEPFDKAGAYAIQGLASKFVARVEGCYFNVVGMPVSALYATLKNLLGGDPGAPGSGCGASIPLS